MIYNILYLERMIREVVTDFISDGKMVIRINYTEMYFYVIFMMIFNVPMFQIMLACMIYIGYYCNSKCLLHKIYINLSVIYYI